MNTSPAAKVRALYDESAEGYAAMMDTEIRLPVYADTLGRLAERIGHIPGPVIDTACGSGHMLSMYHDRYDPGRSLIGMDLSPRMTDVADARLGARAEVFTGDMRDLSGHESESLAAVLSFFAIHHLDPDQVIVALHEWHRVLRTGGQLVVGAWEGSGSIDYGGESDVVALRYTRDQITAWVEEASFVVDRCVVQPDEAMAMDAVYLEGTKA